MSPRQLPVSPPPAEATIRIVANRREVRSLVGSNVQRLAGKGAHYALRARLPRMLAAQVNDWLGLRSEADTVLMKLPSLGFDPGNPGTPVVDGTQQLGTTLKMRGLTPGYTVRTGQFFNIISAGRHWLFAAAAPATASPDGKISVLMEAMIRHLHTDGDAIELVEPKIEGFATTDDDAWTIDTAGTVGLEFEIEERG